MRTVFLQAVVGHALVMLENRVASVSVSSVAKPAALVSQASSLSSGTLKTMRVQRRVHEDSPKRVANNSSCRPE